MGERYEIERKVVTKTARNDDSATEEDLEASDEDFGQVTRLTLFDKKKEKSYGSGSVLKVTVEKLLVEQGTLLLFCSL